MTSIYEKILGADFKHLHPQIQKHFGFSSQDHVAAICTGTMDIWRGSPFILPLLYVGATRRIMFPEQGKNIPFTLENYALVDPFGRETSAWIRTFSFSNRQRRFDTYMIYSEKRKRAVDYMGSHANLAVEIDLSVDNRGGLQMHPRRQWLYEGFIGLPIPSVLAGAADVCEWFDDKSGKFQIEVTVRNKILGELFGYRGSFDVEWRTVESDTIPVELLPVRFERRE